ncbi:hypothetical protein [Maribacter aquivivus]|uniref:hypothetical protein n=1 Tax=Maribacter aquivivus TaxID=228958 RepID=UPI002492A4A2|nr:hypothetical protein [Maribacter aquivivus]
MIPLSERKKELYKLTNPILKNLGFRFFPKRASRYLLDTENYSVTIFFNYSIKSNNHGNTVFLIEHKNVEKHILEIGIPNKDFSSINNENRLFTIFDNDFSQKNQIFTYGLDLSTTEGFRQWGHEIVDYAQGPGKAFIDTYSYLPNVLKEMDRLENEGKYWKEILVGGLDHLFRGLIISKLCDDPNFNMKLNKWDRVIYKSKYKIWHSFYNALKERLKTIEPLYPYYKNV